MEFFSSYNLLESQVSDAFIRARTRGRESHLVLMVERGNDVHRRILADSTLLDNEMQGWTEHVVRNYGNRVPPPSLHETTDPYHSDSDDDEADDCIRDPTTGGRIYLRDAITVVYRLAASLGNTNNGDESLFQFQEFPESIDTPPRFICTVTFPKGSPISLIDGPSCTSFSQARRAACFKACQELFNRNVLDYRLFPLPRDPNCHLDEPSDATEDAISAIESKSSGTKNYPRKKPEFWGASNDTSRNRLYPTVVSTSYSDDPSRPYAPLLILTRHPLPPLPSFKLFFSTVPGTVHLTQGAFFEVDEDRLKDIHFYTLRLCRTIANKPFECPLEKMQYFFAPLEATVLPVLTSKKWKHPNVFKHIPWQLVTLAANNWIVPLASRNVRSLTKDVEDAVVQDRWVEFTRRYDVVRMRPDLTPLSKPIDSPVRKLYMILLTMVDFLFHSVKQILTI